MLVWLIRLDQEQAVTATLYSSRQEVEPTKLDSTSMGIDAHYGNDVARSSNLDQLFDGVITNSL